MVVTESLGAQVYRMLRHELLSGHYKPGQKLKLGEIANRLGISVTPVREALARLVADHAVVQIDHRSVYVSIMSVERFDEICALRSDLEARGARMAAQRATASDIARLRVIHGRLKEARLRDAADEILLANQQFHLELCACACMPVLSELVETLWLQCGSLMNGLTVLPPPTPRQHTHALVIKALQLRDGRMASAAIKRDIALGAQVVRRYLITCAGRPMEAEAYPRRLPNKG